MSQAGMGQLRRLYGLRDAENPAEFDWASASAEWMNRGLDIVGARYGEGRYYSPDDPRFGQETITQTRPVANYDPYGAGPYANGSRVALGSGGQALGTGLGASSQGLGVNVSWQMIGIGLLLLVAFNQGRSRR